MPTNRKVIDFKIHNLTEEQFQELKEAGQIDPNAIYCTPDETVANFEAVNARIDEAIQTEQQHNIEINARVDETVANFEEINTEIEALKDKGGIPLLSPMWADHTLNDMSWLNADTFSWQSGDVYKAAYEHLVSEAVFETGTRKYIYIKSDVSHDRFDNGLRYYRTPENDEVEPIHTCAWKATDGVIVFTKEEAPEGDTAYTDGGAAASSRIGYVTETGEETFYSNAETETVEGITITFCRAEDGHKICPADQEANVQALYEKTGVAWYYIIDEANKQFKLPREAKDGKYLYFYVGNFEREAIEQTAGITSEQLNNKADRDLNNVPSNYDYVIAEQKPNASNNYTWYKKYKSGWVEQGGRYVKQSFTGRQATLTATLPIPVTDFSIIASPEYVSGESIVVVTSWGTGTVVNTIVEKNTITATSSTTSSAHWVVFGNAQ